MCRLSCNLGASTSWSPQGLLRPVMGLLYLLLLPLNNRLGSWRTWFYSRVQWHGFYSSPSHISANWSLTQSVLTAKSNTVLCSPSTHIEYRGVWHFTSTILSIFLRVVKAFKLSFRSFPKFSFSNSCFVSTMNFPASATAKWISGMWVAPHLTRRLPSPEFSAWADAPKTSRRYIWFYTACITL